MITRREMVAGSVGTLLLSEIAASRSERSIVLPGGAPSDELVALTGKNPLIKRSYRPPNFETPLADLRNPFTANEAFFVRYHLGVIPQVDPRTWRLRVGGAAAGIEREWSLDELEHDFEQVSVAAVAQCSGNRRGLFTPRVPGVQWRYGAMGSAIWTGVRLRDVLDKVGMNGNALEVVFDGADGPVLPTTPDFVKSLPVERALDENTLIASKMNGARLPHWNGAPARLVVPGWTATYWLKHLTDIRIEPHPFGGFWMARGYRLPAGAFPGAASFASQQTADTVPITDILVNSLVTSHESGDRLARGRPAALRGWAWDNGAGIAAVEVTFDGGRSWQQTTLDPDLGRFAWRGFQWPLDTSRTGTMTVAVRASSRSGASQPQTLTPNPAGYHHNIIQSLALEVV